MECGASADRLVTDRQTALMIRAAAGQGKGQGRADNARALKIFGVYVYPRRLLFVCLFVRDEISSPARTTVYYRMNHVFYEQLLFFCNSELRCTYILLLRDNERTCPFVKFRLCDLD